MKKLIPLLLVVLTFAACEKDPDTDKLDNKYLVYTNYDTKADFKAFQTYYMPDSILIIGDKKEAEYWKDESAQEILQAYATNMNNRGFVRVDDREEANLGLQVSYIKSTYYFHYYFASVQVDFIKGADNIICLLLRHFKEREVLHQVYSSDSGALLLHVAVNQLNNLVGIEAVCLA